MRDYEYTQGGSSVKLINGYLLAENKWEQQIGFDLDYKSAVNLASALLQWASQLPESERGSVFVNEEE